MTEVSDPDVLIVGGGPAGLSAGLFTARADLETLIVNDGDPILRRNAHLENYPGFPAGVNGHLLLEMMGAQADRAGCERRDARVVDLRPVDDGFAAETAAGETIAATYVVAATKNTVDFLEGIDGVEILDRGKRFVETDDHSREDAHFLDNVVSLCVRCHRKADFGNISREELRSLVGTTDSDSST